MTLEVEERPRPVTAGTNLIPRAYSLAWEKALGTRLGRHRSQWVEFLLDRHISRRITTGYLLKGNGGHRSKFSNLSDWKEA